MSEQCMHSASLAQTDGMDGRVDTFPSRRVGGEWCEHYLPRAEHDPRPEGP